MKHTFTRRRFTAMAGAFASFAFGGCAEAAEANDGRLTARPPSKATTSAKGERALGLERERDAFLRVPANATDAPLPLLVMLHGAGGSGAGVIRRAWPPPQMKRVSPFWRLNPATRDGMRFRFAANSAQTSRS